MPMVSMNSRYKNVLNKYFLYRNSDKASTLDQSAIKLVKPLSNTVNSTNQQEESISTASTTSQSTDSNSKGPLSWPAWVYCTRYSDRPSSGMMNTN